MISFSWIEIVEDKIITRKESFLVHFNKVINVLQKQFLCECLETIENVSQPDLFARWCKINLENIKS